MKATTDYGLADGRLETEIAPRKLPLDPSAALSEATRCLYCFDAPCIQACPTSIDVPTFIKRIAHGNLPGAARTILEANLLGASCARACPVEVLCEGSCVYTEWGQKPIEIGRLQRYALEHGAARLDWQTASATGQSIGLIGAGPASLACAGTLAQLGHQAVIYERSRLPGGLNATGIAPYKLPTAVALEEVAFVESLGVEVRCGVEVGKDVTISALLDRHAALFVAPGLGGDSRLGVPGEELSEVHGAVDWIARMKIDPAVTLRGIRSAAVVGGGNTAIDAARELAQLGVPRVQLVYRRDPSRMKGYAHEWRAAQTDGVSMLPNAVVTRVQESPHGAGRVEIALRRAEEGRATEEVLEPLLVDLVLVAIGQERLGEFVAALPGVEVDTRGCIVTDSEGRTANPRIFAGGDAVNGGREVVHAVDSGQRAARALDARLTQEAQHA